MSGMGCWQCCPNDSGRDELARAPWILEVHIESLRSIMALHAEPCHVRITGSVDLHVQGSIKSTVVIHGRQ